MSADPHTRYREALPLALAGVLTDDDSAWMLRHAQECEACRLLHERAMARASALRSDDGHAPAELLSAWLHDRSTFTSLESELLERHLTACGSCRTELAEMAAFTGQPAPLPTPRRRDWRGPALAGLATAAALVAVFFARVHEPERIAPGALRPPVASSPAPPVPAEPTSVRLVFPERTRAGGPGAIPVAAIHAGVTEIRLRATALFLEPTTRVELRVLRVSDGTALVVRMMTAADLGEDIVLDLTPVADWSEGEYQVRITPDAGRDVAAARRFAFRIERSPR